MLQRFDRGPELNKTNDCHTGDVDVEVVVERSDVSNGVDDVLGDATFLQKQRIPSRHQYKVGAPSE